jgi:hypothetical protein
MADAGDRAMSTVLISNAAEIKRWDLAQVLRRSGAVRTVPTTHFPALSISLSKGIQGENSITVTKLIEKVAVIMHAIILPVRRGGLLVQLPSCTRREAV